MPMSLPLSPIIAYLVLKNLEIRAIERLPTKLLIYFRYVDDVLLLAPSVYLFLILKTFISQ